MSATICACCGSTGLVAHFSVGGQMGEEGLIPTTDSFGTALADIERCERCTHMQLASFPTEADLAEAYGDAASEDYVEEEAGQRATARWVLERIERHVAPGRMLDLGCWVGFQLDEAEKRGWQTLGVEPSAFAAAFARERFGLEILNRPLDAVRLPEAAFEAVFLGDVIEHIPDAGAALDRVRAALSPGGVVAMALPDAGSRLARAMGPRWWAVVPTHVHYFTRRSVGTLLANHGFEPLSFETAPKAFTVRYYLGRLGGYNKALAGGLVRVTTAVGLADRLWSPDFGDRMLVVARASGS